MGNQPATTHSVGMVGLEPTISCPRNTWVCRYPTSRCQVRTAGFEPAFSWSPTKRDARLRHVLIQVPPTTLRAVPGNRTHAQPGFVLPVPRSTGRGIRYAQFVREVGREVLEPSSAALQAAAKPSQLPAQQKKPDVASDTGLIAVNAIGGRVSQAQGIPRV